MKTSVRAHPAVDPFVDPLGVREQHTGQMTSAQS